MNLNIYRNKIRKLIGIILIILLLTMLFGLDYYLKINNYLFYSSGSKEKAFINATWEMSPNEIQRANNTNLVLSKYGTPHLPTQDKSEYPKLIARCKVLESKEHISLWGFEAKVEYAFLDDRLFEYTLFFDGYNYDKMNKIITAALTEKYGHEIEIEDDDNNYLYSMRWETNSERVEYWMLEKKDTKGVKSYLAGVRITYKLMFGIFSRIKHQSTFLTWSARLLDALLPVAD